ncbi:MAG TPA: alpha/beta hydrolase [Hyphomicrobiaceae bacterium]|nr:alpha/beta hydrolase [Hyphomicrobiaceae bacterium]
MQDPAQMTTRPRPWRLDHALRAAEVDGVTWEYIDTGGEQAPLIMLPGSVGTCEMFYKQIASLAPGLRIVAVSYPAEPDPARLADGLAGLMDALRIARASVLGSSFGGYWAQHFALRHPHRVETLVLGNTFVVPDELFANPLFAPERVRASTPGGLQKMWRERVAQAPDSELKRIQWDMLDGRQSAENLRARFIGVIEAKRCPPVGVPHERIVVIDCADDPIIPPASRQAVRDAYAGAEVNTLNTGGHYPHILNQREYDAILSRRLSR